MNSTEQLYGFLTQLADNNNRAWFLAHKELYEEVRRAWLANLDRVIAAMAEWEPSMAAMSAKQCAYRIYRDTRFSSDKTPYKTFFSAAFSPEGRSSHHAGYYLEMSPFADRNPGIYGGVWCLERPMLNKMRRAIVDNIEEWEAIVNEPKMEQLFPGWCSEMLKTAPKGWERDHPQIFYLRMTNYGKFHPCNRRFFLDPDWPELTAELFKVLKPMVDFINYSMDEDV